MGPFTWLNEDEREAREAKLAPDDNRRLASSLVIFILDKCQPVESNGESVQSHTKSRADEI